MPTFRKTLFTQIGSAAALLMLCAGVAHAQENPPGAQPPTPAGEEPPGARTNPNPPPPIPRGAKVNINLVDSDLFSLLKYFSQITGRNFVLGDTKELAGKKITILGNAPVSRDAAYEAFMAALEAHGLSVVQVGSLYKVVPSKELLREPLAIGEGSGRATAQYMTQIITLNNVLAEDISKIVEQLVSEDAKVLAYAPSNMLIITDSGHNIRRVAKLISELDVKAPTSSMQMIPVVNANAEELKAIIEELYGVSDTEQAASSSSSSSSRRSSRSSRRRRNEEAEKSGSVTAGKKSKYISKVMADERTNTLIVIANETGHAAVKDLISQLDVDVDLASRGALHVVKLEHADAQEVANVLQELSNGGNNSANQRNNPSARANAQRAGRTNSSRQNQSSDRQGASESAAAAFDSGMRVAADETTNSLVIIAANEDFQIIKTVIEELDEKRKQVYVDVVVLELTASENNAFSIGYHAPIPGANGGFGTVGAALGTNSFVPPVADAAAGTLSGFNLGFYGQSVDVSLPDGTTLSVPAFGIAIQAIKGTSMVNIVSQPSVSALDNETAKVMVGRKVPFPTTSGLNSLGQPVVTYQREDVAITLELTPRINSEDSVTMEVNVDVQELEESDLVDVQQAGYITSTRQVETSVRVPNNQTVVIGGLVATTETEAESKIPVLGDLPVIGALFRSKSRSSRKSNLLVFLTPHIIQDEATDMAEVMRVKEAQRQEFFRRFYGKSQSEQELELQRLLQYSMNSVDRPSLYRGRSDMGSTVTLDGYDVSETSMDVANRELSAERGQATLLVVDPLAPVSEVEVKDVGPTLSPGELFAPDAVTPDSQEVLEVRPEEEEEGKDKDKKDGEEDTESAADAEDAELESEGAEDAETAEPAEAGGQ